MFQSFLLALLALTCLVVPASAQSTALPYLAANVNREQQWDRFGTHSSGRAVGNSFFFFNTTPLAKIWHTDGTKDGTFRIADGVENSHPMAWVRTIPGHVFYYEAFIERALWRTDGTTSGTRRISSIQNFAGGTLCGDLLCFSGGGNLLRVTDGVSEQVLVSTDPSVTRSSFPDSFVTAGGRAFFVGTSDQTGGCVLIDDVLQCGELWTSDGTAEGSRLVTDLMPGPFPAGPTDLTPFGSRVVFSAFSPHDPSLAHKYIFVSDGTREGTKLLSPELRMSVVWPVPMWVGGRYLYIPMNDKRTIQTDGTPEFVRNFDTLLGLPGERYITAVLDLPDAQLYVTTDANENHQLGVYRDGATRILHEDWMISFVAELPGTPFRLFAAGDGRRAAMWRTDGVTVERVVDLPGDTTAVMISGSAGNTHYFTLYHGGDFDVWQTDGSAAGTHTLGRVFNGDLGSYPQAFRRAGKNVFFFASENASRGLYVLDASTDVHQRLFACEFCEEPFRADEDRVYLFRPDGLWASDGTTSGSGPVAQLLGTPRAVRSAFAEIEQGTLYVADYGSRPALVRKNGATHTRIVDLQGSSYYDVQKLGTRVLLAATGEPEGLIITDGTAAGTKNLRPGLGIESHLTVSGSRAWFTAAGSVWTTDGTEEGTKRVPGSPEQSPHFAFLATQGDSVVFRDAVDGAIHVATAHSVRRIAEQAERVVVADGAVYLLQRTAWDKLTLLRWSGESAPAHEVRSLDVFSGGTLLSDGDTVLVPYQRPDLSYAVLNPMSGADVTIEMDRYSPLDFERMMLLNGKLYFAAAQAKTGEEIWALPIGASVRVSMPRFQVDHVTNSFVGDRRAAIFRISMSGDHAGVVPIHYGTIDGSARAGRDYERVEGVASFGQPDTAFTIVVPVSPEGAGTFSLLIRGGDDVEITRSTAVTHLGALEPARRRAVRR